MISVDFDAKTCPEAHLQQRVSDLEAVEVLRDSQSTHLMEQNGNLLTLLDEYRAALKELVDLKDMKNAHTYNGHWIRNSMKKEYASRRPAAWQKARELLSRNEHGKAEPDLSQG